MTRPRMSPWSQLFMCGLIAVDLIFVDAGAPSPPANLTLAELYATSASIQWDTEKGDQVTRFELTVRNLLSGEADDVSTETPSYQLTLWEHKILSTVDDRRRFYMVNNLLPGTVYQVYVTAVNTEGKSNASKSITFSTLSGDELSHYPKMLVNPGEIIIVIFLLCAWFCAIGVFLHKWGKIRISSPSEPRYKHSPKNLDSVKVCDKPTDSVIYKIHSKDSLYSRTMDARMKRIERMNTMPNIKVNIEPKGKVKDKTKDVLPPLNGKSLGRNRSAPMIELGVIYNKEKHEEIINSYHPPPPVIEVDEALTSSTGTLA